MTYDQDSILATIKKMLGIDDNYNVYDIDIIVLINSALMNLHQLDVGPKDGFLIRDYTQTWHQFLTNEVKLEAAKMYVYLKVKNVFDPPSSASVQSSYERQIQELEWRLNVQAESVETFDWMDNADSDDDSSSKTNVNVVIDGENMTIVRNTSSDSQRIVIENQNAVTSEPPVSKPQTVVNSDNKPKKNYAVVGETLQLFTPGLFG